MIKQKIFVPILMVTLLIILIGLFWVFFGQGGNEAVTTGQPGQEKVITPPLETDYDEPFIEEFNEAARVEYEYTLSTGETIKVKFPEGVDPPPPEVVEKMYLRQQQEGQ